MIHAWGWHLAAAGWMGLPEGIAPMVQLAVLGMAAVLWLVLIFVPMGISRKLRDQNAMLAEQAQLYQKQLKIVEQTNLQLRDVAEGLLILNQQLSKRMGGK